MAAPWHAKHVWTAIIGLWLVALAYYLSRPYLHPDVSWVLLATGRMLDGARPYRDIIEVNPPLIFYSAVIPVWAARLIGLPVMAGFVVYLLSLSLLSLALTARILAGAGTAAPWARMLIVLGMFVALTLLPVTDFGEREHFVVILTLPYVALLSARFADRDCGRGLAVAAGLAAGIGFAFKPHFLAVPVALELYMLIRHRSPAALFRAETLSAGVAVALYAAVVFLAHPEYLDRIVPYGLIVYDAYAKPMAYVLLQNELPTLLLPLATYAIARAFGAAGRALDAFAIAAGGFFVAFVLQAKGWSYHLIPVSVYLWIAALDGALALYESRDRLPRPRRRVYLAMSALGLACMAGAPVLRGAARSPFADTLAPIVRSIAPTGSLYAFTSHVWVAFPLVSKTGIGWASRFPAQWLLPGAVNGLQALEPADVARRERLREVERFAVDAVIEDLERDRPEIVVVDLDNPYFHGSGFDFLGYFAQDPRFRAFWRDYVRIDRVVLTEQVSAVEQGTFNTRRTRRFDVYCRPDAALRCVAPDAIATATPGSPR